MEPKLMFWHNYFVSLSAEYTFVNKEDFLGIRRKISTVIKSRPDPSFCIYFYLKGQLVSRLKTVGEIVIGKGVSILYIIFMFIIGVVSVRFENIHWLFVNIPDFRQSDTSHCLSNLKGLHKHPSSGCRFSKNLS